MSQDYAPSNYDDDFCLKPPLLLWFAVLYLSRAFVLPISVGIAHIAKVNGDVATVLRGLWNVDLVIPALLALPVLYAFIRRTATASGSVRWLWAHGRMLLAFSAIVDLVLPVVALLRHPDLGDGLPLSLAGSVVDVYFLLYILGARRVRDTFASFPAPLDAVKK